MLFVDKRFFALAYLPYRLLEPARSALLINGFESNIYTFHVFPRRTEKLENRRHEEGQISNPFISSTVFYSKQTFSRSPSDRKITDKCLKRTRKFEGKEKINNFFLNSLVPYLRRVNLR